MLPFSQRLEARLVLATVTFMLLLLLTMIWAVNLGLRQTESHATQRSAEGLETQGVEALLRLAEREGRLSDLQLQQAAQLSRVAAGQMAALLESGQTVSWDSRGLRRGPKAQWYDANRERRSEIFVPNSLPLDATVLASLQESSVLDAIFPSLLNQSLDVVALYYVSPEGATRYVPVGDLAELLPPDLNVATQPVFTLAAPEANPTRRTVWTPPYIDDAGNGLLVTASTPVYVRDEFRGVIGVDVSLVRLIGRLSALQPTPSGYAFLADDAGRLVAAPPAALADLFGGDDPVVGMRLTRALGRSLTEVQAPPLAEALAAAQRGQRGVARLKLGERPVFLAYAPLPDTGWSLSLVAPMNEVTAQTRTVTQQIRADVSRTVRSTLLVIGTFFVLAVAGVVLTSRWLMQPIAALVAGTQAVAKGDLAVTLPVTSQDELGRLADSFNGMTQELRAARRHLEQRVEERTRELAALLEVSRTVASTLELEPLLSLILHQLKDVVAYTGAAILKLEGEEFRVLDYHGPAPREQTRHLRLAQDEEVVYQEVIQQGAPILVADLYGDSPLARAFREAWPSGTPPLFGYARSWLGVPLIVRERTIGMLRLDHAEPDFFTPQHARLVMAFANQVAVAIENAYLYGQAQQAAVLEERQRLARELHDSVSQALYGIALGTKTARALLERDPDKVGEPLDYVLSLAQGGLTEMRALIFELRPESLELEGLVPALSQQAEAMAARHGLPVALHLGEEPEVPFVTKEALYRVAQEAMHNTLKHARASQITLRLATERGLVHLEVADDGQGFNTAQSFPGHLGLRSMSERIEKLGGTFTISSAPGAGTTIQVRVRAEG